MTHPAAHLDEVVHQRFRLGILTITAEADRVDFGYLKDSLELTAGNLSRHLDVLDAADLIAIEKGYEGRRARTWISLTKHGRKALTDELNALRKLLDTHAAPTKGPLKPRTARPTPRPTTA